MIKVGVVGGTGYTGVELLRLLAQHPEVELRAITSRGEAGMPVADMFPSLRRRVDLRFVDPQSADLSGCDVVFFATPNGIAMQQAAGLVAAGVKVIDLAADFRISDIAEWEKWYGMKHACPELVAEAVYGLPEVNREAVKAARVVANPGCYPTAVQLGFLPLVEGRGWFSSIIWLLMQSLEFRGLGARLRPTSCSPNRQITSRPTVWRGIVICREIRQGCVAFCECVGGFDVCAAPYADDSRHSCDSLCAADEGCGICRRYSRLVSRVSPLLM